jgi:putative endonuclease
MSDRTPRETDPTPKASRWRRWFGSRSEQAAERFFKSLRYQILARNYRCPLGELDLVAADGDTIIFVEVRSTACTDLERPTLSVNTAKQDRLTKLALHFLQRHQLLGRPVRFDVLALSWPDSRSSPIINHYPDAFEASDRLDSFF